MKSFGTKYIVFENAKDLEFITLDGVKLTKADSFPKYFEMSRVGTNICETWNEINKEKFTTLVGIWIDSESKRLENSIANYNEIKNTP